MAAPQHTLRSSYAQSEGRIERDAAQLNGRGSPNGQTPPGISPLHALTPRHTFAQTMGRAPDGTRPVRSLLGRALLRDVLLECLARRLRDAFRDDPGRVLRGDVPRMVLAKIPAKHLGIDADFGGQFLRSVCLGHVVPSIVRTFIRSLYIDRSTFARACQHIWIKRLMKRSMTYVRIHRQTSIVRECDSRSLPRSTTHPCPDPKGECMELWFATERSEKTVDFFDHQHATTVVAR